MKKEELKVLFNKLTVQDKISQTIQLNGDLLVESGVMKTGPQEELGFKNLNIYEIGSIYNVNNPEKLKRLQKEALEKSHHKIPLIFMSDIIYGFRTIFPMPLAQAGSYDFELIRKAAEISAKESYLNGIHTVFSPMLDIVRDPRWGRVMESPGEDVYTAEAFGKSVVNGYQGMIEDGKIPENHVAACIKHFAAYGAPESGREYSAVELSNQKLFNEYLKPYQAAIEANCRLVMTSFNLLNGVPATGNKWLNRDVLREKFGFDGVLVSDHGAIGELVNHGFAANDMDAAKKAIEAGVDFDMMTSVYANSLPELVKMPQFVDLLDEAVWRILVLKNDLGLFENPYRGLDLPDTGKVLDEQDKETATELVEKSCVLLKNQNATLPIKDHQKVAVIGPYGESHLTLGFWASVSGKSTDVVTLKEGLLEKIKADQVSFTRGFNLFNSYENFGPMKAGLEALNGPIEDEEELLKDAIENAQNADIVILTIGENFVESGEGASKAHLVLPEKQKRLIKAISELGKPMVGLIYTGRPLVLTDIEGYFDSLLLVWFPGIMGGRGITNILIGEANPSARLAMTFPRSEGQIPIYKSKTPTGRPLNHENLTDRFVSKYIDESNDPLFDFGTGLSYSKVTGRWIAKEDECQNQKIKSSFKLVNCSDRLTDVVVHIYVKQHPAEIVQPIRRLIKSYRVTMEGKTDQTIEFEVDQKELSYFDNQGIKHLDSGEYQFELDVQGTKDLTTIKVSKEKVI
jgi:beta-glucosidase